MKNGNKDRKATQQRLPQTQVSGRLLIATISLIIQSLVSNGQTFKRDSTYSLLLVADTSRHYSENGNWRKDQKVWWEYGYVISETHNTLENYKPPLSREEQLLNGHDYIKFIWYYIEGLSPNGLVVFQSIPVNDR